MNSNKLKTNRKNKIGAKTIIFWSTFACAVIVLIVCLVVRANNNKATVNYDKLLEESSVKGQEIFQQEGEYFVLFYDFNGRNEMKTFDETMYTYLDYYKNHSDEEGVLKVYAADTDEDKNKACLTSGDENLKSGVCVYPGIKLETNESVILKIKEGTEPVLLHIKDGVLESDSKKGETAILKYLETLKK